MTKIDLIDLPRFLVMIDQVAGEAQIPKRVEAFVPLTAQAVPHNA